MRFQGITLALTIVFGVVRVNSISEKRLCHDIEQHMPTYQLKTYLFCDYDSSVRPALHGNVTTVKFGIFPKFAEFFQGVNSMYMHSWTALKWDDAFLTWDPKSFNSIEKIHVSSSEIWVPDITVHAADTDVSSRIPLTSCEVNHNGEVRCISATLYTTECIIDHVWWPYEKQNCTIQFASWSHFNDEIEFPYIHQGIVLNEYQNNSVWHLESAYVTERVQPFKYNSSLNSRTLSLHFIFVSDTTVSYATILMPAIVLMVLTLMTLWLDSNSVERMIVGNISFICHFLCIADLHYLLPDNKENPPNILLFYEGSLILTTFTLILTTVLRELYVMRSKAPIWLSTGVSYVLKSKVGQILLLSILDPKASACLETAADDNADLVQENKKDSTWEYVTVLTGWIAFFIVLVCYNILLGIYFPREAAMKLLHSQ